jgi:hypothetical protein
MLERDGGPRPVHSLARMTALRIDRSRWPLLLNVFNGEQEPAELERYMREMDAIYDAAEPFIAASFMLRYRPDMAQLKRLADWTRDRRAATKKACLGTAIIAPSAGFRFLFSTLLMMQPIPIPYCVVSDVDEACAWIEAELAKHGKKPPREMRAFLREQLERERARG